MLSRRDLLLALSAAGLSGCSWRTNPELYLTRWTSSGYGRHAEETGEFKDAFRIFDRLVGGQRGALHHFTHGSDRDAVHHAMVALRALVASKGDASKLTKRGREHLFNKHDDSLITKVRTTRAKKLVIFSDHHLTTRAHRHNVFSGRGGRHFQYSNHDLYVAALRDYWKAGYTLVENGDVEDLVVFDAQLYPGEFARRNNLIDDFGGRKALRDGGKAHDDAIAALDQRRIAFRETVLTDILVDPVNRAYYAALAQFASKGRLFRVGGNHDYQVQRLWAKAAARARATTGGEYPHGGVYAMVLGVLRDSGVWDAAILHGHQFDQVSSPANANIHGETISECMGTWYQGPDRIWPWTELGREWASGRPFNNILVSGTPGTEAQYRRAASDNSATSYPAWDEARRRLWGGISGKEAWEGIFNHPIAWEYLEREGSGANEDVELVFRALSGDAWFKYRHTEELRLAAELDLPDRCKLVLGHTHEPRHGSLDPYGNPVPWYLNSGAAGRFEGLVWGVELDHGEARIVSWHPEPFPDGPPVRRVWRAGGPFREVLQSKVEALS